MADGLKCDMGGHSIQGRNSGSTGFTYTSFCATLAVGFRAGGPGRRTNSEAAVASRLRVT